MSGIKFRRAWWTVPRAAPSSNSMMAQILWNKSHISRRQRHIFHAQYTKVISFPPSKWTCLVLRSPKCKVSTAWLIFDDCRRELTGYHKCKLSNVCLMTLLRGCWWWWFAFFSVHHSIKLNVWGLWKNWFSSSEEKGERYGLVAMNRGDNNGGKNVRCSPEEHMKVMEWKTLLGF